MAVYTDITEQELTDFVATYDIGDLLSYKGIAEGVENSNFLVHCTGGNFILTLYEKRVDERDLPFFLGLMEFLSGQGIPCPLPVSAIVPVPPAATLRIRARLPQSRVPL